MLKISILNLLFTNVFILLLVVKFANTHAGKGSHALSIIKEEPII